MAAEHHSLQVAGCYCASNIYCMLLPVRRNEVFIKVAQYHKYKWTDRRQIMYTLDPSAAPPSVFRLARSKSGWRTGTPTCADQNSAGGGAKLFRRRRNSAPARKCARKDPNKVNNF